MNEAQTAALLTEEEWEELERFWAEEYDAYVRRIPQSQDYRKEI